MTDVEAVAAVIVAVFTSLVVKVTRTVEVEVAGLIERNEEQKEVAFFSFKTSTITWTLEHCVGVRFRASMSPGWTGDALTAKASNAVPAGREKRILRDCDERWILDQGTSIKKMASQIHVQVGKMLWVSI